MLFAFIALLLISMAAGDCAADNCLRAMRATQIPGRLQSAQSFCKTFAQNSVSVSIIPTYAAQSCVANQNAAMSARISSACSCIGTPATLLSTATSTVTTGACAIVASSWSVQKSASPTATPTVTAQLAHNCLTLVPLNKTAAIALVDAMEPYLEWQSDSAYKKDPPSDYFYPPHDIFSYLASVRSNLENGTYKNEYEFQEDLYQVFARGHDGHFIFYPDALTKAFEWGRQRSLVSISSDGSSLPQIKLYEDVVSEGATASVVTQINGIDAATYVANFAYTASFNQDADAAYNSMFFEKAFVAARVSHGYFSGGGRLRYIYPGAATSITFANGSMLTLDNIAKVKGNFFNITDGTSFYQRFCKGTAGSSGDVADIGGLRAKNVSTPEVMVQGYPPPVIITNDKIVSGYYLDGTGYEDVAVLAPLAFESGSPLEFQQVAQQFFADAKRDGKTKLVIDLSANGGGYILQGYDLFRQLFPDIVQDGYSRFRESDTLLTIAQIFSEDSTNVDPNNSTNDEINIYETFFNFKYDLNLTNQQFESFDAKFDPHVYKGDDFTNIIRWNLNDPLTTRNETYGLGIDINGYNNRTKFTQPFAAEDIVMLFDGYCASTCTLFSEFMRIQGGVKSIAMGGRPKAGPIQSIGGIKGAEILSWSEIYENAQTALQNATQFQADILNRLTRLPLDRSSANGINVRDNILRDNLSDGLPAQYVVEEADCRLYWTEPMITDITAVWKAAANAAFNGKSCVDGGIEKRAGDTKSGIAGVRRESEASDKKLTKKIRNMSLKSLEKRDVSVQMTQAWSSWMSRHLVKAIP